MGCMVVVSSCQSAATSEIVKRCCSSLCKQRYSKYSDLYLYLYLDGGRVIRSNTFIASDMSYRGVVATPPRGGWNSQELGESLQWAKGVQPPPPPNSRQFEHWSDLRPVSGSKKQVKRKHGSPVLPYALMDENNRVATIAASVTDNKSPRD